MEALLKTLIDRISRDFKELKDENQILRKEILGIRASSTCLGQTGMELMETRTLREIVEEIQFDLKTLKTKFETSLHDAQGSLNGNNPSEKQSPQHDPKPDNNDLADTKESLERVPFVEIQCKAIQEEKKRLKRNFNDSVKQRSAADGTSLRGTTLQKISSSIVPNPDKTSTSCTLKLSNFLSYALTDPRFHFWNRSINKTGPSEVESYVSEAFTFQGSTEWGGCQLLCSFGINNVLRLTIYSYTVHDGSIRFGMAFTPQDVLTDWSLYYKLTEILSMPDVCMNVREFSKGPLEVFINHGKLLARGQMTTGPFSTIRVDILEFDDTEVAALPASANMKHRGDVKNIRAILTYGNSLYGSTLGKITCIIEMANCLNSTLKNRNGFVCNSPYTSYLPPEIRPFYREMFFTSDDTKVETMFSYDIESTDLCIVVALRAQAGNNSFAIAFVQPPVEISRNRLGALMEPKGWKTHLYMKCAKANDGEQVIRIRNIQARARMTEAPESRLMIRLFAV